MTTKPCAELVSLAEFERIFESVKNWGRWGPDDQLGTINLITPERVAAAAALVRSGRRVSMAIPINTVAGPDNPNQAIHHVIQGHDIDIGSGGLRFGLDFLGMAFHGDCHSHVDALCHISYNGQTYNGKPALEVLTTMGATQLGIERIAERGGLVGRGVLLDVPALPGRRVAGAGRGRDPGRARGLRAGPGRAPWRGRHLRLPDRPPSPAAGARGMGQRPDRRRQGRPPRGHHPVDARAGHRRLPARRRRRGDPELRRRDDLPDPSPPDRGHGHAHRRQPGPGGLVAACAEEGRYEFMVVGLPLRLPGGTGSPWNPIAIF